MTKTRTLYHVTLRKNIKSILKNGLSPKRARTKYKSVWYVSKENVSWAIEHVVRRHNVRDKKQLVVIEATVKEQNIKTNRWSGIYHSDENIKVTKQNLYSASSAEDWIKKDGN